MSQIVYDLTAMTTDEAVSLIRTHQGELCGRLYRRPDGTFTTIAFGFGPDRVGNAQFETVVMDANVNAGRPGAVLNGGGAGSVVRVTAPDVTIRGVTIRGSGRDLQAMDSGVFLEKTAERALVEDSRFEGNLFGIYVHGAAGSRVLRRSR